MWQTEFTCTVKITILFTLTLEYYLRKKNLLLYILQPLVELSKQNLRLCLFLNFQQLVAESF